MGCAFDIITFDCYGTLIDWERGISTAFARCARRDGIVLSKEKILRAYHDIEPAVEARAFRKYREVLAETARRVARRLGWNIDLARAGFLPDSLPSWRPFSDTNSALEKLAQAGFRLGLLSNTDEDLLRETRKHFPVKFDLIVTAEQVGCYKPAPGHFLEARKRIGDTRWLHAAQSYFHDIVPARELYIRTAWINRKNEHPSDGRGADFEFRDLADLARVLCGPDRRRR